MLSMLRNVSFSVFMLASVAAQAQTPAVPQSMLSGSVTISGAVEHPMTLTLDQLVMFSPQQLVDVTGRSGTPAKLKGVLLRELLKKAGVVAPNHNDTKKIIIIASATDGYKVVFSWSEIFNSSAGNAVIVYTEKDGKPLADDEGRIALMSGADTNPGSRHVKWLNAIEVRKIVD